MVSYQWDHKEEVRSIVPALKNEFSVWIDFQQMIGGDLLDKSMLNEANKEKDTNYHTVAQGVEQCDIILIFVSRHYQNSPNCELEAKYARRLKKKFVFVLLQPDFQASGWWVLFCLPYPPYPVLTCFKRLGILLGMKLYFILDEEPGQKIEIQKLIAGNSPFSLYLVPPSILLHHSFPSPQFNSLNYQG